MSPLLLIFAALIVISLFALIMASGAGEPGVPLLMLLPASNKRCPELNMRPRFEIVSTADRVRSKGAKPDCDRDACSDDAIEEGSADDMIPSLLLTISTAEIVPACTLGVVENA